TSMQRMRPTFMGARQPHFVSAVGSRQWRRGDHYAQGNTPDHQIELLRVSRWIRKRRSGTFRLVQSPLTFTSITSTRTVKNVEQNCGKVLLQWRGEGCGDD